MEAYLFDFGKVVAGFDHMIFCRRLASGGSPLPVEEIYRIVFRLGFNDRFETGSLQGEDFFEELKGPLNLSIERDRFQDLWCDIFRENPGMDSLLEALHTRARLVLVSNTNAWHMDHVRETTGYLKHFDSLILSYEHGVRKPDAAIFRAAVESAGCAPDRCLYFDDLEENVQAASAFGLNAVLFRYASHPQRH